MTTFLLKNFNPPVPVTIPAHLQGLITEKDLKEWPHFLKWHQSLQASLQRQHTDEKHPFKEAPFSLIYVSVLSVKMFGTKIGFVKIDAIITNKEDRFLPGTAFLRGNSVAMLMILRPRDSIDERWVIMTEQPRIPAGTLSFMEIPAGMMDERTREVYGVAVKEIKQETGLVVPPEELIDMTELALKDVDNPEALANGMYPSPGGSDEFMHIVLWEKVLDRQEIEDLRGNLAGERKGGELITVRLRNYEDLWRVGARDAKTLAAWSLYESLKRSRNAEMLAMERKSREEGRNRRK
ncbi:hypothetical protein HYFRA_00007521 [Hymenoscyphus fraxineus]|uniref:Nudix hydrolase domain-containing protein n=1 Tax=Hymenoscyphus fraxineus TaxID=746836 RepID=A0A9N9KSR4_9HELO|nr:hypothetical protein HYFRA_00007521 [Hymenoscyphus fraxineus]